MENFKVSSKVGWILSCDRWPYLGGLFNMRVCLGSEKQGWKLFCSMLDKFVEKLKYVSGFRPEYQIKHPTKAVL